MSKLIETLFVRELVSRLDVQRTSPSPVTVTLVNLGKFLLPATFNSMLRISFGAITETPESPDSSNAWVSILSWR